MSHERIAGKTLPLTPGVPGANAGTRRSTVSVAASILQKAGMISYTRGNVTILKTNPSWKQLPAIATR